MIDKIIIAAIIAAMATTTITLFVAFVLVVIGMILNGHALIAIFITFTLGPLIALMVAIMIKLAEGG